MNRNEVSEFSFKVHGVDIHDLAVKAEASLKKLSGGKLVEIDYQLDNIDGIVSQFDSIVLWEATCNGRIWF